MGELLTKAINFASKAHEAQTRKLDHTPAILHSLEAASIVAGIVNDEELIVCAVLHDTVEDTDTTIEEIRTLFGERVAHHVAAESENKREHLPASATWKIRKEESLQVLKNADRDSMIIWMGDKLSNMRTLYRSYLLLGDEVFNFFNQKDKNEHAWYYKTILEYLSPLADTTAYQEYADLTHKIFDNKE